MNVFRYEVPIDDVWHDIELTGPVVKVACRESNRRVVQFWALDGAGSPYTGRFRVFGTGDEVPDNVVYKGTGIAEPYAWHLFELAE
jgi:hypothetical protein